MARWKRAATKFWDGLRDIPEKNVSSWACDRPFSPQRPRKATEGTPLLPFLNCLAVRSATAAPDVELLTRFIENRDEDSFTELVRRHGPVVYRLCRRLVGPTAADDTFQATFLVLATRPQAARSAGSVAGWLVGVTGRVAQQARRTARRRAHHETVAATHAKTTSDDPSLGPGDQFCILDEELTRLPDRLRGPVVTCWLEGRTQDQAAAESGLTVRTIRRRLDKARRLLRRRLERRGVIPILAGGLVASSGSVAVALPGGLVERTTVLVFEFLTGGGGTSPTVALAKGVAMTMLIPKVATVLVLTAVGLTALGVTVAEGLGGPLAADSRSAPPGPALRSAPNPVGGIEAPVAKAAQMPLPTTAAVVLADENILQNGGFEEGTDSPKHWSQGTDIDGVEYIWDKKLGKEGKASLCLHKTAQRYFPIAQWYQIVDRKGNKPALRVTGQVKAQSVTKAIIDVIFLDENGKSLEHKWASYIGAKQPGDPAVSHDWKEYQGRVEIPPKAKKIQIGLQIYGPGKVWFDEVRAEYVE